MSENEIKNNDELVTENVQTDVNEQVGSEQVGTGEVETQEDNTELPRD
jgi:hypothetical protein